MPARARAERGGGRCRAGGLLAALAIGAPAGRQQRRTHHPGLALSHVDGSVELDPGAAPSLDAGPTSERVFGAVQALGYRPLPLVSVSLIPELSLDAYASWGFDLHEHDVRDRYLAGFTWTF